MLGEETYSHLLKSITINNVNLFYAPSLFQPTFVALLTFLVFHKLFFILSSSTDNGIQIILYFNDQEVFETWLPSIHSLASYLAHPCSWDLYIRNLSYNSVEFTSANSSPTKLTLRILFCFFDCIILSLSLSFFYSVWCVFKKIIFCFLLFDSPKEKLSKNNQTMNENNLWKTVYHHLSL